MYCTIRIIFYYILIICCFLLQVSFLLSLLVLYGWEGTSRGTIFVKQRDEYMYRCDIIFPLLYPFYLLPHATVMPNFCNKKRVRIVHYLGPVQTCFFFSVKLKHVILLLNYYPFLCLKVSCWKPSNQIKKNSNVTSTVGLFKVSFKLMFEAVISPPSPPPSPTPLRIPLWCWEIKDIFLKRMKLWIQVMLSWFPRMFPGKNDVHFLVLTVWPL